MEEEKREKALHVVEDVIEVRPEIMSLLDAFDSPFKGCTKGSARALCMLKKGTKKRKRAELDLGGNVIEKRGK
mgnify:FL=1